MRALIASIAAGFVVATLAAAPGAAQSSIDAPENPATDHHGLPGNNPGFGGSSANPQGQGANGGGGIHGIDNVPGHNPDNHPGADGVAGFASQLGTVHGGLGGGHGGGHGNGHGNGHGGPGGGHGDQGAHGGHGGGHGMGGPAR
jgi:hypothetical protein